jgi:transposase-like protein
MPSKGPNRPSKAWVYAAEFKRSAVQRVTGQKDLIAAAARAVGVSAPSLRQQVRAASLAAIGDIFAVIASGLEKLG